MDNQILERLMMDDAVGALEPDVSALLAAYVATLPEVQLEAARWRGLGALVRRATVETDEGASGPLPAFPAVDRSAWWRRSAAIAAVWLIGLGVGFWWPHRPHVVPGASQQIAVVAPVGKKEDTVSSQPARALAGVADFWSSRRLLAAAGERDRHSTNSLWRWTSPVRQPEMEGVR